MDKSYVTMITCLICKEPNGELMLDMRLKDSFEKYTPSYTPCEKCKNEYLSKGVILIEHSTGRFIVMKDKAFSRIFRREIPNQKIAFVEEGVFEKLEVLKVS